MLLRKHSLVSLQRAHLKTAFTTTQARKKGAQMDDTHSANTVQRAMRAAERKPTRNVPAQTHAKHKHIHHIARMHAHMLQKRTTK